jgi:CxxC-x17-CxxC domain-containing protein
VSFEDKTLVCRDCGNEFVFTAGEQEFYAQKGFTNEPQRCRDCRQVRKQRSTSTDRSYSTGNGRSESYGRGGNEYGNMSQGNDYANMSRGNEYAEGNTYAGNAARGNEYDGGNWDDSMSRGNTYGGNSGGGRSSDAYARQERVQHETVCAQCGRPTTVPFVPRAGRPVYCQACFAERRGPAAGRGTSRDSGFNRF